MAMPKKGSAKISVDGTVYRWKVGKHRSASLRAGDRVLIEAADVKGAPLAVVLDIFWCDDPIIRPGRVADWISRAKQAGWKPEEPGKTFSLELGPVPQRQDPEEIVRIFGLIK